MHEYFFKTLQLLRIFKNTVNIYFRMVHHNPRQRKYLNISYGSAVYITIVWEESFSLKQLCMKISNVYTIICSNPYTVHEAAKKVLAMLNQHTKLLQTCRVISLCHKICIHPIRDKS